MYFLFFLVEEPASSATSARVLGELGFQGETTNLQTAEGMILTGPKMENFDTRDFSEKRQKKTYRTLLI